MADAFPRPAPAITPETEFFWDGVIAGELRFQQCDACHTVRHPPSLHCRECASSDWSVSVSDGLGEVYSFIVPRRPPQLVYDPDLVVGLVELADGVRIVSNIRDCPPDELFIGLAVEVFFDQFGEAVLPQFRPRRANAGCE